MPNTEIRPYQSGPPVEQGERLATFPRNRGDEELRVTLATYNGHAYVALRVWARGQDGEFWPVRGKGCSVRLAEAGGLAEALAAVAAAHRDQGGRRGSSTWYQAPVGRQDRRPSQRALPRPSAGPARHFDEFDDGDAP
jgi:hypothetical protein